MLNSASAPQNIKYYNFLVYSENFLNNSFEYVEEFIIINDF